MHRVAVILLILTKVASAQPDTTPLFASEEPLTIRLNFSIKELKKNTNDTIYTSSVLAYKTEAGTWDSMKIDLRARGHFRRANCSFPPLKVKIKKAPGESPFAGNKNLKLVVPCQSGKTYNDLVIKEYLAYQLFEEITPYYFNTRLINLTLIDGRGKNSKTHKFNAFFIEDDGLVAKRLKAKVYEADKVHPVKLADTVTVMLDFFEYMISNTDWSAVQLHNIKVFQLRSQQLIPIAYDFDMSGLVNAPYSQVSELVGSTSVRDRVYRGFCRNPILFDFARSQYLQKESALISRVARFEGLLPPAELADVRRFLGEFFATLKNDRSFADNIVQKCRK